MSERAALEVVFQIGGFPSPTMAFALAIQMFSYWTSLPFRLPHEDEIRFENSSLPEYWNSLKTLVYTRNKEFKYRTYHPNGGLNEISSFEAMSQYDYDVHLICDDIYPECPVYDSADFSSARTFDEIVPMSFGLFRGRIGSRWNIYAYENPGMPYLSVDFDRISSLGVCNVPCGDPMSGYSYIGLEAVNGDNTSFYEFYRGAF